MSLALFLGYSFEPKGLSVAPKILANFLERKTQLYEQGADVVATLPSSGRTLGHLIATIILFL